MNCKIIAYQEHSLNDPSERILTYLSNIFPFRNWLNSPTLPYEAIIYNNLLGIRSFKRFIPTKNIYNIGDTKLRELLKDKVLAQEKIEYIIKKTKLHELLHLFLFTVATQNSSHVLKFTTEQNVVLYSLLLFVNILPILLQRSTRQRMYELLDTIQGKREINPSVELFKRFIKDDSSYLRLPN